MNIKANSFSGSVCWGMYWSAIWSDYGYGYAIRSIAWSRTTTWSSYGNFHRCCFKTHAQSQNWSKNI